MSFIFTDKINNRIREGIRNFPEMLGGERADENLEKDSYIAVALESKASKVIGYILLEPAVLDKCQNIQYLEVLKDYQNNGVGKALIDMAIQYVKSKGEKAISVSSYSETVDYYRKLGFVGESMFLVKDVTPENSSS